MRMESTIRTLTQDWRSIQLTTRYCIRHEFLRGYGNGYMAKLREPRLNLEDHRNAMLPPLNCYYCVSKAEMKSHMG